MKFFLIVYDRVARHIVELREFEPAQHDEAMAALFEREMRERLDPRIEVVLLAAESLAALKHTHRRYFLTDTSEPGKAVV